MTTPKLSNILIGQWQSAPRLRGIVDDVLQPILDDAVAAADQIQLMQDINQAVGVWLDYLGLRLGIDRPATTDPTLDERFGFDAAGQPFDIAPFRGSAINDAIYPLPDAIYRRMVKARAITVFSDGTIFSLAKAVKQVDLTANVFDFRDMTVLVGTSQPRFMQLADEIGALPRAAGVEILYGHRLVAGGSFPAFTVTSATVQVR